MPVPLPPAFTFSLSLSHTHMLTYIHTYMSYLFLSHTHIHTQAHSLSLFLLTHTPLLLQSRKNKMDFPMDFPILGREIKEASYTQHGQNIKAAKI